METTKDVAATTTAVTPQATRKFMAPEIAENVSDWVSVLTWIVGAFAAMLAVASWYFSNLVAKHKDAALKQFQQESKVAVASANARAEEARAVAAEANAKLAEAAATAASAQRDAEKARLETERLKTLVSWRDLSEDQKAHFRILTANAVKGPMVVTSVQGDMEAANFAQKLAQMFREAGYSVTENLNSFLPLGGLPPRGLRIEVKGERFQPAHAGAIQQALEAVGLPCPGSLGKVEDSQVGIFVGGKP